jgi:hypothetical protein
MSSFSCFLNWNTMHSHRSSTQWSEFWIQEIAAKQHLVLT